ncbi:hypothetical protein ABBQ38_011599 [Trebouxia sp. C0009 RCD-2024]
MCKRQLLWRDGNCTGLLVPAVHIPQCLSCLFHDLIDIKPFYTWQFSALTKSQAGFVDCLEPISGVTSKSGA